MERKNYRGSRNNRHDLSDKRKIIFSQFRAWRYDLELEFMMEKGSNAGVYLQSRYEVQMLIAGD